jgi:hypothetical protein
MIFGTLITTPEEKECIDALLHLMRGGNQDVARKIVKLLMAHTAPRGIRAVTSTKKDAAARVPGEHAPLFVVAKSIRG